MVYSSLLSVHISHSYMKYILAMFYLAQFLRGSHFISSSCNSSFCCISTNTLSTYVFHELLGLNVETVLSKTLNHQALTVPGLTRLAHHLLQYLLDTKGEWNIMVCGPWKSLLGRLKNATPHNDGNQ